jgi:hypothetical protein
MAVVQGVKERVHLPIYDSVKVDPEQQLRAVESSSTLKFFVNVQGKTKLETNLQAASLLPHYNTFEARAMRVVISDLPAEFPNEPIAEDQDLEVTDDEGKPMDSAGKKEGETGFDPTKVVLADVELGIKRLVELLKEAQESDDREASLDVDEEDGVVINLKEKDGSAVNKDTIANAGGVIFFTVADLEGLLDDLGKDGPPKEQLPKSNGNGATTLINKLIFNTVTTLFVGEKIMIEAPTWMFPGGAGAFSDQAVITTHGVPSPMDTFRFAEPVYIDKQQNFRVEIEIPDTEVLREIQKIFGPFSLWVLVDGYMTRDVQ